MGMNINIVRVERLKRDMQGMFVEHLAILNREDIADWVDLDFEHSDKINIEVKELDVSVIADFLWNAAKAQENGET